MIAARDYAVLISAKRYGNIKALDWLVNAFQDKAKLQEVTTKVISQLNLGMTAYLLSLLNKDNILKKSKLYAYAAKQKDIHPYDM